MNTTGATATPVTQPAGCFVTNCVVLNVPSATAGTRMIANPLPYNIDWSKVRVRVGGVGGTIYTPTEAFNNSVLSNQIWIWNGTNYSTWNAGANTGNLQYFKSFFVRVLASGADKTIDLLIPALVSTLESPTPLQTAGEPSSLDANARSALPALSQFAKSKANRNAWMVDLVVHNVDTGWNATAKLGQWPGTKAGRDAEDMIAMAPFAQPYLTVVFPHQDMPDEPGDYSADLRPNNGWADKWHFEVRAQPLGSNVVLRWKASERVLASSRIIDRDTGLVIYPANPSYAKGYPITLDTPVRRLTWEYMGN